MARRKVLRDIANGLLGSFNSRNNDVDGYWGIGKLYSLANARNTDTVTIDLLKLTILPKSENFNGLIQYYRSVLRYRLGTEGITLERLRSAIIVVEFNQEVQAKHHLWGAALGDPYTCKCRLIDDSSRVYEAIAGGNCRIHDPQRERQRSHK